MRSVKNSKTHEVISFLLYPNNAWLFSRFGPKDSGGWQHCNGASVGFHFLVFQSLSLKPAQSWASN